MSGTVASRPTTEAGTPQTGKRHEAGRAFAICAASFFSGGIRPSSFMRSGFADGAGQLGDDVLLLLRGELGKHGQREHFVGVGERDWEIPPAVCFL